MSSKQNKTRIELLRKIFLSILPGIIVAGLIFGANIYYDLDLGKVIVEQVTKIIGMFETTATTTLATVSGNVGIKTTTPSEALTVSGGILATDNLTIQGETSLATTTISTQLTVPKITSLADLTIDPTGNLVISKPTTISANFTVSGTSTLATTTLSRLTITELTPGSVLFAGAGGLISQDNSNLFWDNTNKRLGIGTSSPSQKLDVQGGNINVSGSLMTGGVARIDSSGNLINIGNITLSGTISGTYTIGGTPTLASSLTGSGSPNITGIGLLSATNLTISGTATTTNLNVTGLTNLATTTISTQLSVPLITSPSVLTISPSGNATTTISGPVILASQTGNVGIGTTAPNEKLEVSGNINVKNGDIYIWNADVRTYLQNFYDYFQITMGASQLSMNRVSGNIGIGTTTPSSLLELYKTNASPILTITSATSTTYSPQIAFRTGATPTTNFTLGVDISTGKLKIVPSSDISTSTGITIDSSGNVGIGTTTPNYKLTVSGGDIYGSNNLYIAGNVGIGTTSPGSRLEVRGSTSDSSASALNITNSGGTSLLYVRNDGNVGIGTTNPGAKLDVVSGYQRIQFLTGTNTSAYVLSIGVNDDGVNISNDSTIRGFNFKNANGTLLTITSGGNVGIGTTAPLEKLDVAGAIKVGNTSSACDDAHRGVIKFIPGASGVADHLAVCEKDASDVYNWVYIGSSVGGFKYRKLITINNTQNTNTLTDYQVLVTLDTASLISAGKMRSDCGDIRFTDSDGVTNLNYWLESGCNTASTKIWVKVPSIPASSSKTIYVYYGNSSATSQSNATAVFDFFENFEGSSYWTPTQGTCGPTNTSYGTPSCSHGRATDYVKDGSYSYKMSVEIIPTANPAWWGFACDWTFPAKLPTGIMHMWYRVDIKSDTYNYTCSCPCTNYNTPAGTCCRVGMHVYVPSTTWIFKRPTCEENSTLAAASEAIYSEDKEFTISGTPPLDMKIYSEGWFGAAGVKYFVYVWIDQLYVRKYTSPEPTTSVGTEEAADIAEWFKIDPNCSIQNNCPEGGDLVAVNENGFIERSSKPYQQTLIGIISSNPKEILGEGNENDSRPVALIGTVPVKVSTKNGEIKPGDYLTSSDIPGVAMKANGFGRVIGMALEPYNGEGIGKIKVFLNPHFAMIPLSEDGNFDISTSTATSSEVSILDSFTLAIKNALKKLGLFIEDGIAKVKEIVADVAKIKKIKEVEEFEMKDKATGEIYCVWIENGEWKKVKGECESLTSQPTTSNQQPVNNETTNNGTASNQPMVNFLSPSYSGKVGEEIKFEATTSNFATDTLTFNWYFGDGATSTTNSPSASHAYNATGTYNLTLTVTGGDQTASTSTKVEISANESQTNSLSGENSTPTSTASTSDSTTEAPNPQ